MVTPDELARTPLLALLPPVVLARLAARAADIHVAEGEWLVRDGETPYFWTMIDGEVEVLRTFAGEVQQATTFDPGEYFGEVPLMLGAAAIGSVRALRASRLARIEALDFHTIIEASPEAAALLAQTLVRRVGLIGKTYATNDASRVTIVGGRYDVACHDLRDFLSRNQIVFEWLDPENEADVACIAPDVAAAGAYPIAMFTDGTFLVNPEIRELARRVDLQIEPGAAAYDVVIIGGGPSGLAAAVYGGSEGLKTLMIEREAPGGQAGTSSRIENYLGFPSGISGGDLANRALLQAKRFGTEILVTRSVTSVEPVPLGHVVHFDGGDSVTTRAVVIATGVSWRKLEAEGAEALIGRGVYYGAARTEALGTQDKEIFLIGGGNSAGQAAMFFANYARHVTLLVRGASLAKSMSHYLIEQLTTKSNVAVETFATVTAVRGDVRIEAIAIRDGRTGEIEERCADGVFTFIGADADTSWLPEAIERDRHGYLVTGRDLATWPLARTPLPLETSLPGVFASGDVRCGSIKRVAASVGEGSMVIAMIHEYLAAQDEPALA